ncbi:hypothetical protein QCA50_017612 [Cerrena zonata]|uniref:Uncharacterized protein n=1 Tax=Cerrena zonata TaxID=2478898 RepID=A0AAW0FQ28_9APHY
MAGDSFLSDPSRKRKRSNKTTSTVRQGKSKSGGARPSSNQHDEEISSGSDSDGGKGNEEEYDEENVSSDEEFAQENAADKRRRLAKQYLDNLKNDDFADDDFDAQDMDDDIVSRRLQMDVAEDKGFIYKFIGDKVLSQIDDCQASKNKAYQRWASILPIKFQSTIKSSLGPN